MGCGPLPPALVSRLYREGDAARWGLAEKDFAASLSSSVDHAFGGHDPGSGDLDRYLRALHLTDMALARACALGSDAAWNFFVTAYRPLLYRSAEAIDRSGNAQELADSIYADLFGVDPKGGERQSLFRYFHGRSTLATWLRAVLSQRFVDRVRQARRMAPLPDEDGPNAPVAMAGLDLDSPRMGMAMRRALSTAIAALAARDRLRLMCYYVQNLTLAEIGRLLSEHEATASRHLAQTRKGIRAHVERVLREEHHFDDQAVAQCFNAVVSDAGELDLTTLMGTSAGGKIRHQDRSKR
jgi:RNA polymerase sigma factor (sigma-70 family)